MQTHDDAARAARNDGGQLRLHPGFSSRFLSHDRTVIVSLPPGYERDSSRRYPVLYLHDGQNLFDPATAFIPGHTWGVDKTAHMLAAAGKVQPLIVVGIYNTGEHRIDEYTPTTDARVRRGGMADLHGRMVVEELIPFVNATYRTRTEPEATGLGGSSLGGLVTLYVGLRFPHVFGRLAVLSPAAWWDQRFVVRWVHELPGKTPQRIWLDMGTREGRGLTTISRELRDALVAKGWRLNYDLKYFEARNGRHTELAWARRVGPFLRFLFPTVGE